MPQALQRWIDLIIAKGHVAVDTETTGLDNQTADLVGICLATEPGNGCYIPLGHSNGDARPARRRRPRRGADGYPRSRSIC